MIVINAHINQAPDFSESEIKILRKYFESIGIDDFYDVGDIPELLHALMANRNQSVILFSNFSPNYHYSNNGVDISKFRYKPVPNWREERYSFSASLYNHICKKYSIVEVHFITSALKRVLNDIDFSNVTSGINTKVQRKREWLRSDIDYKLLLRRYMVNNISATNNSLLIPNTKILLHKPAISFCQN